MSRSVEPERQTVPEERPRYVRLLASRGSLGFNAGDANLYRYVGNNPTNLTDPSGLAAPPIEMNQGKRPPIDWSKGKSLENVNLFGTVGKGTGYEIEIGKDEKDKPIKIIYFKPSKETKKELSYDCHGLTFSGGAFSPEGDAVPAILKQFYKEIPKDGKIQAGDILVGTGGGHVKHSATIIKPAYDSNGKYDPSATLIDTKNGRQPQTTPGEPMTVEQMVLLYSRTVSDWTYYTRK